MMANKTEQASTTAVPPHAPLSIKTYFTITDDEPLDSNSTETIIATPAIMAPPAPLHLNTSARRQSTAAAIPSSFDSPSSAGGLMTDIALDSNNNNKTSSASSFMEEDSLMGTFVSSSRLPRNSTTKVDFELESPVAIELQRFRDDFSGGALDLSETSVETWAESPSRTKAKLQQQAQQTPTTARGTPSFFSGFMAIPPSLAGRPPLTEASEEYIRREFERGPAPLMWPKENDIENPVIQPAAVATATAGAVAAWFSSWWSTASTPPTTPAAVATKPSAESRREGAMAQ